MNFSTYGPSFRAPYAENIQLSVEREFPSRLVARASYVGSLARHNQATIDANPITPAGHAACVADTTFCGYTGIHWAQYDLPRGAELLLSQSHHLRPDRSRLGTAWIPHPGLVSSYASSSYHSLQALINKGTTHGLNFELAYTWSHAMDTGSSFENSRLRRLLPRLQPVRSAA